MITSGAARVGADIYRGPREPSASARWLVGRLVPVRGGGHPAPKHACLRRRGSAHGKGAWTVHDVRNIAASRWLQVSSMIKILVTL